MTAAQINNFSTLLQCPVLFTPLVDAVVLAPCGHTISASAVDQLYHSVLNEQEQVQTPACPLCRRKITTHSPNMALRDLVSIALSIQLEKELPTISATLKTEEEIDPATIPFPGIPAKFVPKSGSWDFEDSNRATVRTLDFISQTTNSLFNRMSVHGHRNGEVSLRVHFENHKEIALEYLKKCGIKICKEHEICSFYISNLSDTKRLFKILMLHNEIPSDKIPLIRDLVIHGNWKTVTPSSGEPIELRPAKRHRESL